MKSLRIRCQLYLYNIILLYKTINGFDTAISDADMKSIGDKMAGLYNYPNEDVLRIDTHVLKKAA